MKQLGKILIAFVTALLLAVSAQAEPAPPGPPLKGGVQEVTVAVAAGHVELGNASAEPVRLYIYSITGQMVKAVDVAPGAVVTVTLPAGYYIVRTPDGSRRIKITS